MTSQSPLKEVADERYERAWTALSHLILVDGMSWSGRERNCVYLNAGRSGRFANVSAASDADYPDDARAAAVVDWDEDGRLDLVLRNRTGPRLRLLRNQAADPGRWLQLDLKGMRCNRDAIGARVVVELEGRTLTRSLHAGDGYLAQSSKRLHFGLGPDASARKVTVHWPGGGRSEFTELPAGRYRVVQGAPRPFPAAARSTAAFDALEPAPLAPEAAPNGRIVLVDKLPAAELPLPSFADPRRRARAFAGAPVLVNLWATWCSNCLRELAHLQARRAELDAAGLRIAAISTDAPEDRARARERIAGFGLEADAGYAGEETLHAVELLLAEVIGASTSGVLPTSLLLDSAGQIVVVYQGPVDADQLLRDLAALRGMDPRERHTAPLAGGRWTTQYPRDFLGLARAFEARRMPELSAYYRGLAARNLAEGGGR